ncbi:MAG: DNA polymerase III subunit gamma/tau [Firmicutes bacterium]|nr:DNA polymerase III subunit gamma/tau [Bacillota bacterium]
MHLALYRKWRSVDFDDVTGQEHITSVLKYQVSHGSVSHAYLFSGPRGIGKTSCAKILSRAVNCENPVNGNPCNECASCRAILSGASVDVIEMDAASNNSVDNIRDIIEGVSFTPAEMKYRVYIIDEVHMLSVSAFNALLKTLEEPPEHVIFILATTELRKLPETVISRCQRFDFARLSVSDITDRLDYISKQENIDAERSALSEIARISDGGMRDAISLFELCCGRGEKLTQKLVPDVLGTLGYEGSAAAASSVAAHDIDALFSLISDYVRSGRDISVFISDLSSFYRDMLVVKTVKNPEKILELPEASFSLLMATAEKFSAADIIYQASLLDDAANNIARGSSSKRMLAEMTLVKMCDPSLDTRAEALAARVSALEDAVKLLSSGVAPPQYSGSEKNADENEKKSDVGEMNGGFSEKKPEKPDAAGAGVKSAEPIPYWGELISKAVERVPFFEGFRELMNGGRTEDGFAIECRDPFTEEICRKNKPLFAELFTVFEGRSIDEGSVAIKRTKESNDKEDVPLDDIY